MKVIGKYVSIQVKIIPFEVFWFGRCLYHYKVQSFIKSALGSRLKLIFKSLIRKTFFKSELFRIWGFSSAWMQIKKTIAKKSKIII